MTFQYSHDLGQKGFEPFRADATTDLPNAGQDSYHFALVFLAPSFLAQPARLPTVLENSHGIFVTHFDEYQFTEYDRQKKYRGKKDEVQPIDPAKFQSGKYQGCAKR